MGEWWKKFKRFWAGEDALHTAVRCGDIGAIKNLLRDGFHMEAYNSMGYTPLQYSLLYREYVTALFLLEQNADPNAICYSNFPGDKGKAIQASGRPH